MDVFIRICAVKVWFRCYLHAVNIEIALEFCFNYLSMSSSCLYETDLIVI